MKLWAILPLLFIKLSANAQFLPAVEQAYFNYNAARINEAQGKIDSAVYYIMAALKQHSEIVPMRFYAWDLYFKAGRYKEAINDIEKFYKNNPLPKYADFFFEGLDSSIANQVKASKEMKVLIGRYEDLKKENRTHYIHNDTFFTLVEECFTRDQFSRHMAKDLYGKSAFLDSSNFIIEYVDSVNIRNMVAYLKQHSFPSFVKNNNNIEEAHFTTMCLHWMQPAANYKRFSDWVYLENALKEAVYTGKFPVKNYVYILDRMHMWANYKEGEPPMQLYGSVVNFGAKIAELENVDKRRAQWLLPTLYEEKIIDPDFKLPAEYKK